MDAPSLGYCRRGIVGLVEGSSSDDALAVVERSCATAGNAHRTALCQALEALTGVALTPEASVTRVLFLELERILARLWTLSVAARAINDQRLFGASLSQREALLDALELSTGQRRYWAVPVPGGVRAAIEREPLSEAITAFEPEVELWRTATSAQGVFGALGKRAATISAEQAQTLALTGLAATGSRATDDLRQTAPAGGYAAVQVEWPSHPETRPGDTAARLKYAVEDLATSVALVRSCLATLGSASVAAPQTTFPPLAVGSTATARIEGPHGPVGVTVTARTSDRIGGLHLDVPGAATVAALPSILEGQPMGLVPLIVASLDLCPECLDQ